MGFLNLEKDIFRIIRIDITETAQMIREKLKEAFPHLRFSVRCTKRVSYEWINIEYIDGPPQWEVEQLVEPFIGKGELYFHALKGLTTDRHVLMDGELARHANDAIHVTRRSRIVEGSVGFRQIESVRSDHHEQ